MCDLTELFIAHNGAVETVLDEDAHADAAWVGPLLVDYRAKVTEIRLRVASLPSAYTKNLPTSNDWVYEACRIAAIIYTSAIVMRVPFSIAAEPDCNVILLHRNSVRSHGTDQRRRHLERHGGRLLLGSFRGSRGSSHACHHQHLPASQLA